MDFDFDKMKDLHEENPSEFEATARKMIDDYIDTLPSEERKRRARGVQFVIDSKLSHIKDPIARMNKMVELFWAGVSEFQNTLNGLNNPSEYVEKPKNTNNIVVGKFE